MKSSLNRQVIIPILVGSISVLLLILLVSTQNKSAHLYSVYSAILGISFISVFLGKSVSVGIFQRLFQRIGIWSAAFIGLELLAALVFYANIGLWHCDYYLTLNANIYEPHPYLVGTNKANADVMDQKIDYAHDSLGNRLISSETSAPHLPTLVTIGSSTTYGVGVPSESSYPAKLQEMLAGKFEVINMGVGGYSSVENLIQTALLLPQHQPQFAVYMIGMNDARNARLKVIEPDYSNYHARTLRLTMGLCPYLSSDHPALVKVSLLLAEKLDVLMLCPGMNYHIERWSGNELNPAAFELFERNILQIIALCRVNDITPLFVPEVIPGDVYPAIGVSGWFPFMDGRAVASTVNRYNEELKRVCRENDCAFAESVSSEPWTSADFVDGWHPKPMANERIAEIIAAEIMQLVVSNSSIDTKVDSSDYQGNP